MVDIMAQHTMRSPLPLHFIRFNPDVWRVDGKCRKVAMEERHKRLLGELTWSNRDFAITYLYYNMVGGRPALLEHAEFPTEVKACCRWPLA